MESIQIKGSEALEINEKQELDLIVAKHMEKIKRMLNNTFFAKLAIKVYSKDKENKVKRKRFSIDIELTGEIPKIFASSEEWDLSKSANSAFLKIEHEIEHKFHVSEK
jgi:ribosome-associated translation inhibitor RaiA